MISDGSWARGGRLEDGSMRLTRCTGWASRVAPPDRIGPPPAERASARHSRAYRHRAGKNAAPGTLQCYRLSSSLGVTRSMYVDRTRPLRPRSDRLRKTFGPRERRMLVQPMAEPPTTRTETTRFHPLFERWARDVRGRLLLRRALTGLALGLALA